MRAYLPLSHKQLESFLETKTLDCEILYAPTALFREENHDCDEEELEYLLSALAGEKALDLCLTQSAPGIVLALEIPEDQVGEEQDDPKTWHKKTAMTGGRIFTPGIKYILILLSPLLWSCNPSAPPAGSSRRRHLAPPAARPAAPTPAPSTAGDRAGVAAARRQTAA